MSIFNTVTFAIEDVKDFWVHSSKYRKLTPMMIVCNQQGTKLLGVGSDDMDINSSEILTFYSNGKKNQIASSSIFFNSISSWMAMETSLEGSLVFVGGEHEEKAVIGAISFDEKMSPIKFIDVDPVKLRAKVVHQIRRFIGTDTLLLGCSNLLFCFTYSDKIFTMLRCIEVRECEDIIDISIIHNKIYLLDDEGNVFIRSSACRFDSEGMTKKGKTDFITEYQSSDSLKNKIKGGFGSMGMFMNQGGLISGLGKPGLLDPSLLPASMLDRGVSSPIKPSSFDLGKTQFGDFGLNMLKAAQQIQGLYGGPNDSDPSKNQVPNSHVFSNEDILRSSLHNSQSLKINLDSAQSDGAERVICFGKDIYVCSKNRICLFSFDESGVFVFKSTILGNL